MTDKSTNPPPGRLEGHVAPITGGTSGIGRATALLFAREEAKVIITSQRVERRSSFVIGRWSFIGGSY